MSQLQIIELEACLKRKEEYISKLERQLEGFVSRTAKTNTYSIGTEDACSTHPKAPHGFNRNSSHTNGRYTCDCEGWAPL